jgi:hypothetical protein
MELAEYNWESVSLYLTPKQLSRILEQRCLYTLESLTRCRTTVMKNMFTTCRRIVEFLSLSQALSKSIFSDYLIPNGFVPSAPLDVVSNDRFGFISKTVWVEWDVPSVNVMRRYWDLLILGTSKKEEDFFNQIFQNIVSLLPGPFKVCRTCKWSVPETEMDTFCECCYCADKGSRDVLLDKNRGVYFLKSTIPTK